MIVLDGSDGDEDDRKPPANKLAGPPEGSPPAMISLLDDAENSPRKMKRGDRLSSSTACKPSDDLFGSRATDREQKLQHRREKKRRALSKAEEADQLLARALQEQVGHNLLQHWLECHAEHTTHC